MSGSRVTLQMNESAVEYLWFCIGMERDSYIPDTHEHVHPDTDIKKNAMLWGLDIFCTSYALTNSGILIRRILGKNIQVMRY